MLIDSEDPVADPEKTWAHLFKRDRWIQPQGASDEQVLFMTTCMETWIVADRTALRAYFKQHLQENALPALENLESRSRHDIHDKLVHATRGCSNAYKKGERSFAVLELLNPAALEDLPSFARAIRILQTKLTLP